MKKLTACFLLCGLLLQLFGCAPTSTQVSKEENVRVTNLTAQLSANEPQELSLIDYPHSIPTADFSVELLKAAYTEGQTENLILSPYSALLALAMTANGAQGETLKEMEAAFGMGIRELNSFLYMCLQDQGKELICANSLWFGAHAGVQESFLQTNKDYLNAQVFQTSFDDKAVEEMNAWVKENTKNRIEKLIEQLDPDTVMVLLNALSFDGKWQNPFKTYDTHEGSFYAADGTQQIAQMMSGTEYCYLDDGLATGFVKNYQNDYCFVALLPNENVSMEDYLASLTGAGFAKTIETANDESVQIAMPKLDTQSSMELNGVLEAMGMELAFEAEADFSAMGTGCGKISRVLQKTYLQVDEEGTKAAAATSVAVDKGVSHLHNQVILDRPYVMAILDKENGTILFMGVVNEVT